MMSYTETFMDSAIAEAKKSKDHSEVPIGCVIVKDQKIIAFAHNTTCISRHVVSHAEINAIRKASILQKDWRLNEFDLFVTMEPCLMCMGAIILARIRTVYYGLSNYITGAFHGPAPIEDTKIKTLIVPGVFEEEVSIMVKGFFAGKRTKKMKKP